MKKIKSLFKLDFSKGTRSVTREWETNSSWVQEGKGKAYIKRDGHAILIKEGKMYRRLHHKLSDGPIKKEWIKCEKERDPNTMKMAFWIPLVENQNNLEIFKKIKIQDYSDGTYELVGDNVRNIFKSHKTKINIGESGEMKLIPHFSEEILNPPRTYDEIKDFFTKNPFHEGIIFLNEEKNEAFKVKLIDFNITPTISGSAEQKWIIKSNQDERKTNSLIWSGLKEIDILEEPDFERE